MSRINLAVRSLHPERTATAVREADTARAAALDAVNAFTTERFPGLDARAFFHYDGSFGVSGFGVTDGLTRMVEPPTGLRYDAKAKMLVPAKKTDEGKALAKEMSALGFRYPHIDGLGSIVHGYVGGPDLPRHERQGYFTGWTFHALSRADGSTEVYATLPVEHLDERAQNRVIDEGDTWEPVRLSAFHAAFEEHTDLTAAPASARLA